jgi:hypothetical protein
LLIGFRPVSPISLAFWHSQPDSLRRLVPDNDGCRVLSLALPMRGSAQRDSRLGSELPPFLPCTAPMRCQPHRSGRRCHPFTKGGRNLTCTSTKLSSLQRDGLLSFLRSFPPPEVRQVSDQRIAPCGPGSRCSVKQQLDAEASDQVVITILRWDHRRRQ